MTNSEKIANARALFTDEISLRIFDKRIEIGPDTKKVMFPDTLEFIGLSAGDKSRLLHCIEELQNPNREKYIYGAGIGCKSILERINGRILNLQGVAGIIDNNVKENRYGLCAISFSEFIEKHKGALVFNSVGIPAGRAIHKQCVDAGIEIISLFELDKSWDQYFDLPSEMGLVGGGEVFVHAGCYNGDTQKSYVNWFGDTYERMVTFEPGENEIEVSKENLKGLRDIEIVSAGLSEHSGSKRFSPDKFGVSYISDTGSQEIRVVSLDDYMGGQRVTFIALDVEGEESAVLHGAKDIIKTQKPKLAISVYHKPEDIWELPLFIKECNPGYKLYLRHYHLFDMAETVLYAF